MVVNDDDDDADDITDIITVKADIFISVVKRLAVLLCYFIQ